MRRNAFQIGRQWNDMPWDAGGGIKASSQPDKAYGSGVSLERRCAVQLTLGNLSRIPNLPVFNITVPISETLRLFAIQEKMYV